MTAPLECCTGDCQQGRTCPLRTDRRAGPSVLWALVSWFVPDRRSGKERRVNGGTESAKRRTG